MVVQPMADRNRGQKRTSGRSETKRFADSNGREKCPVIAAEQDESPTWIVVDEELVMAVVQTTAVRVC